MEAEPICCLTAGQEVQGTSHNYEKDTFEVVEAHGEDGLSSLKSLNLSFVIDREHDGVVGGIEVETDDVADLLDEEGVIGNLEMPLAMGLKGEQVEPPLVRALGDSAVPPR